MIYEFKSRATGSVIMTKPVAEWILQIVGKMPGPTGIITVAQMPSAIDALNRAIAAEKEQLRAAEAEERDAPPVNGSAGDADSDEKNEQEHYKVSLAQRAFPFIEMLEAARSAGKDVTWGV